MRFSLLCTLLLVFIIQAGAMAQKITVRIDSGTLDNAFRQIIKQSDVQLVYNTDVASRIPCKAVEFENADVSEILSGLLAGTPLAFRVENGIFIINEKPERALPQEVEELRITGTVKDNLGHVLPGVTVLVKGTTIGVATDVDGKYSIQIPEGGILQFSSLGFATEEIKVGSRRVIDVSLMEEAQSLEQSVVIGYGTMTKRDITGAISQVSGDDVAGRNATTISMALQGAMPGVQVTRDNGAPGAQATITIRGITTIGDTSPLIIVDGVPMENGLNNLNSNDIESMEVLKDASSAAIYGSRGSNGVILITTKKGRSDNLSVSYDGYYGLEQVSRKIDLMNAYEYAQLSKEAHDAAYLDLNPGGTAPNGSRPESFMNYPVELIPYLNGEAGLTDTDWQDAIFRNANTTSHNISISRHGGDKSIQHG